MKLKKLNEYFKASAVAAIASLLSQGAVAAVTLEEIVVTAQKRSENLQQVPIAISAFTAETLSKKGISVTDDLTIITPGLQAGRQTGSSTPYMRGVGTQSAAAGEEGSIAMYVDGVYSPSPRSNTMSFNNVERIEVLKGPQGTLFGRNATGGLIHVITRDPSQEASGKLELSYGSYDTTGLKLYVTGGLSDTISADVAVIYENQDEGWGVNLVTGNDVNLSKTTALRSKILFEPSDSTSIKLGLNYSDNEGDIGMTRQIAPGALGGDGLATFLGCVVAAGGDPAAPTAAQAGVCVPLAIANATVNTGDAYNTATARDNFSFAEDKGVSLHVSHSFENLDVLSVTAFQQSDYEQFMDVDASIGFFQEAILNYDFETFTQEFQLTSTSGEKLEWLAGLFFMDSTSAYKPFSVFTPFAPPSVPTITSTNSQDTTSISAYVQGSYDLTDATKMTLGVRVTKDERKMHAKLDAFVAAAGGVVPIQAELSEDWVEPTWRLALDHQLSDDTLIYASYSRGFKSGVYNLAGLPAAPVDPETLDAFEVGVKTDLFDNRLRLNMSTYFYQYENVQLQKVQAGSANLVNAAEAEVLGLEIDATWLVTEAFSLSTAISVIDSEYTDYPDATINTPTGFGGNAQSAGSATGNKLIRTPDYTFNVGANYEWSTDAGDFAVSAHYYYNDGFFWEAENRLKQDDYQIVNAELSWTNNSENVRVRVYGRNLSGDEYSYYGVSSQASDAISAAPPKTFGAAVELRF